MLSTFKNNRKLKAYIEQEISLYPGIFENSPDIFLFVIDLKGVIVTIRGGLGTSDIIGKNFKDLVYKEDLEKVLSYFKKAKNGEINYIEYRVISPEGGITYLDVTLVPIFENKVVIGVYGLTHNTSEKEELKDSVQKNTEKLNSLIYYSHEIISILDAEGIITFESPSVQAILGYEVDKVTGKSFFDLIHPGDLHYMKKKLEDILSRPNNPIRVETRLKHKNGEWLSFEIIFTNLLDSSSVEGIICNIHDVTEIKKQQLEIQYMAYHDYLTELPNRRAFEEKVDLEIRLANVDNRKFAVLFLNLDGFKILNDSLGHDIGDLLLKEIARTLKSRFHNKMKMIARTNGDEFAILTTNLLDVSSMEKMAIEILQVFQQQFTIKDYNLNITTSIGISIYPESGDNMGTLMTNAGLALYLAEKSGSNNYQIFSPSANVSTYKVFSLRKDLQQALQNNQFVVYYQPIVNTETKQVVSVEALIRWNHPEWGIVPPNEFIPMAEESGIIVEIGEWVLQTVCRDLSLWHTSGYFIKAAVNLSFVQFFQTGLIDAIRRNLQANNLDPKWLGVEITESTLLQQKEKVLGELSRIREMGVQISLDDFGTGYASYRSIIDIKPTILKIDKSFIKEFTTDKDSVIVVTSIIQLAKSLGIGIIAEGVETKEQYNLLLELESDWVQGYLFSRPVSAENIEKMLQGQWDEEVETPNSVERRKYFRIDFQHPLEASMTIEELNGRKVDLGNTNVLIKNIGPGGLLFLSNIKLPVSAEITLKLQTKILQKDYTFYGKIAHDSEVDDIYSYGIKFIVDEKQRENLIKELNQFQLQLRNNPILKDHSFVVESSASYFQKL